MTMPPIDRPNVVVRLLGKLLLFGLLLLIAAFIAVGVALSPIFVRYIDGSEVDWSRLSDIGQAYGAVSALLSALALGVIVTLQRSQVRYERSWLLREMHVDIIKIALDDPVYTQCWGPRMAPPGMDERLFYYVNLILNLWFYSWQHGELRDEQVRVYAASLFEGAVGREFWVWHGGWSIASGSGRRRAFLQMVDREYQRAVLAGPPRRGHEVHGRAPGKWRAARPPRVSARPLDRRSRRSPEGLRRKHAIRSM
jgi:hypothetical protein